MKNKKIRIFYKIWESVKIQKINHTLGVSLTTQLLEWPITIKYKWINLRSEMLSLNSAVIRKLKPSTKCTSKIKIIQKWIRILNSIKYKKVSLQMKNLCTMGAIKVFNPMRLKKFHQTNQRTNLFKIINKKSMKITICCWKLLIKTSITNLSSINWQTHHYVRWMNKHWSRNIVRVLVAWQTNKLEIMIKFKDLILLVELI